MQKYSFLLMAQVILLFLLILPHQSAHALTATERAREMCRPYVEGAADMNAEIDDNTLCRLRAYSPYADVRSLASDVERIARRLVRSGDQFHNTALKNKLKELNRALYSHRRPNIEVPNNPVAQRLNSLHTRYETKEQRQQQLVTYEQQQQYIRELLEVAQMSPTGADIINCYKNQPPPLVNPVTDIASMITFIDGADSDGSAKMIPGPAPAGSPRPFNAYIAIYGVNENSPSDMMEILLHEMQHGCNATLFAQHTGRVSECSQRLQSQRVRVPADNRMRAPEATTGPLREYADLNADYYRDAAVDEMRAYGRSAQMMLELAQSWPESYCSDLSVDSFSRTLRSGNSPMIWAEIVDGMSSGTDMFENIMFRYTDIGSQQAAFVFSHDERNRLQRNSQTRRPIVHPDLMRRLQDARSTWRP